MSKPTTKKAAVLDEMSAAQMEQVKAAMEKAEAAKGAEATLLQHLAREAVLAGERDELIARLERVTQSLVRARQERTTLARAVEDAGGKLPTWEV